MPRIIDFRERPQFIIDDVPKSGSYLGKKVYWKLYTVENFYRVIVHSILSVQISSDWWLIATPPPIQRKSERFKENYLNKPWHTMPGEHLIYFTDLNDLNEITRTNSGFFVPLIPTIDEWVLKIEDMRLPRNVVAHMNFPNKVDRQRIDTIYEDFKALMKDIGDKEDIITLKVPK
ncbi:MAG: hypothetical protein ACKKMP_03570 [Candidatus Nealsonbacteria bacterium]